MKPRPLAPRGGNDRIMTPPELARTIVEHFRPSGRMLDPCSGDGAFTNAMRGSGGWGKVDWCEITQGRDFFTTLRTLQYDWIVTNPPWGKKFRPFLQHSMELADNIVFLCLINAWFMTARQRDIRKAGFGLVEVLQVPTPPKPWPQAGFALGAGWLRSGWQGGTTWSVPS